MNNEIVKEKNLLFEEDVRLTEVREFGFSWHDFATENRTIPPQGLQFEIHFEGEVNGEELQGRIKGVDYLTVRSDKRLFLNLHATITIDDGALIKVVENGINDRGALQLNMDFHTNDDRYTWLNHKHVWGVGTVDFATGKVKIKGYQNQ
jgi:hypothetical protein